MVLQEDSKAHWFSRMGLGPAAAVKEFEHAQKQSGEERAEEELERQDRERAFEIADSVEKGIARELVSEFMQPLRRSSKLWRFHIVRSDDKLQYRLFSDAGDFLMYARASIQARKVEFYLYNPSDDRNLLFDPFRSAFTMTYDKEKTEWRIIQERCEHCQFAPKHLSCASHGKQQVSLIRQSRALVGSGVLNRMEVHIPGVYTDGSRVVWCPLLGRSDLAGPCNEDSNEAQHLVTKRPVWNNEAESLVLDFKGRPIQSSAKNFQLALQQKPDHVICQYGKIGSQTFSLDFKFPFSIIQAFGISLTTLFWT